MTCYRGTKWARERSTLSAVGLSINVTEIAWSASQQWVVSVLILDIAGVFGHVSWTSPVRPAVQRNTGMNGHRNKRFPRLISKKKKKKKLVFSGNQSSSKMVPEFHQTLLYHQSTLFFFYRMRGRANSRIWIWVYRWHQLNHLESVGPGNLQPSVRCVKNAWNGL